MLGSWDLASSEIVLHPRQSQAQRRCTLTHELVHAERADLGECSERIEELVHAEAARRLITIEALVDAAMYHEDDLEALAEALWVDLETLQARLAHLHPAERGYLQRRLSMKEHTA